MIIRGKDRDYYDHVAHYGVDKTVVYMRNEAVHAFVNVQPGALYEYNGFWRLVVFQATVIGVAGKLYPVIKEVGLDVTDKDVYARPSRTKVPQLIHWSLDSYLESRCSRKLNLAHLRRAEELFRLSSAKFLLDVFKDYNCPVFAYRGIFDGHTVLTINPNIKKLGLGEPLPAQEAFTNIAGYINGYLREKAMVNIADKDKLVAAGFDPKQSFRHRK